MSSTLDSSRARSREARLDFSCRICRNSSGNRHFVAREMMLGLREEFDYAECGSCGTLQILRIPDDLSRFYPDEYYSKHVVLRSGFARRLKRPRALATLGRPTLVGNVLVFLMGPAPIASWIRQAGTHMNSRILDLGSGNGQNLLELSDIGFTHLQGADPFIAADVTVGPGIPIRKAAVEDVVGEFDLIMINHVLEHAVDPEAMLKHASNRLSPGGKILIRTPVAGSFAWHTYGPHWVQLDAPRHLHVFSETGLTQLAERCGLGVESVVYDSSEFQFWASEQYRSDVALSDPGSFHRTGYGGRFSRRDIRGFKRKSIELNANNDGDQACIVLSPTAGRVPDPLR